MRVVCVSSAATHAFSKAAISRITLLEGLGVEGDAHCGALVKHRSRVAVDPSQPNLRQVHLISEEWLQELALAGFDVMPGQLGENITTSGLDLIRLPLHAVLRFGPQAAVRVTGLRNPCAQLDHFQPGLMAAALERDAHGALVRKAGIMGVVIAGGLVRAGDGIELTLPKGPFQGLERV
jgi:MOSC domain-containing protein YiiM